MGNQISEHFRRSEYACRCGCGFDAADKELNEVHEDLREYFTEKYGDSVSVEITGPNRCIKHNETIQKKDNPEYVPFSSKSTHINGIASDLKVWIIWHKKQVPAGEVSDYLERRYPDKYGIGRYNNRTHIDIREIKARWIG